MNRIIKVMIHRSEIYMPSHSANSSATHENATNHSKRQTAHTFLQQSHFFLISHLPILDFLLIPIHLHYTPLHLLTALKFAANSNQPLDLLLLRFLLMLFTITELSAIIPHRTERSRGSAAYLTKNPRSKDTGPRQLLRYPYPQPLAHPRVMPG